MHCFWGGIWREKKKLKKRKYDTMAGGCCIKPDIYCMVSFYVLYRFFWFSAFPFSSESSLNLQGYRVIPKELSFAAYDYVFSKIWNVVACLWNYNRGHFIRHDSLFNCYSDVLHIRCPRKNIFKISKKYFSFYLLFFYHDLLNGGAVSSYMVYTQIFVYEK